MRTIETNVILRLRDILIPTLELVVEVPPAHLTFVVFESVVSFACLKVSKQTTLPQKNTRFTSMTSARDNIRTGRWNLMEKAGVVLYFSLVPNQ